MQKVTQVDWEYPMNNKEELTKKRFKYIGGKDEV